MPSTEVPVKRKNSLVLVPIHDLIFWPLSCKLRAYEEDSFFGGGYMVYFVARFSVVEMGLKNQKSKRTLTPEVADIGAGRSVLVAQAVYLLENDRSADRVLITNWW